jgi:hypothetical protein
MRVPLGAHEPRGGPLVRLAGALSQFAYGMTGFEFARHALETRAALENVFVLCVAGDMIGVPVLREREFTDEHQYHLHGV